MGMKPNYLYVREYKQKISLGPMRSYKNGTSKVNLISLEKRLAKLKQEYTFTHKSRNNTRTNF